MLISPPCRTYAPAAPRETRPGRVVAAVYRARRLLVPGAAVPNTETTALDGVVCEVAVIDCQVPGLMEASNSR